MPAVVARFRSGQIAIEVRVRGARDVPLQIIPLAPAFVGEAEATVDDRQCVVGQTIGERPCVDERRERHSGARYTIRSGVWEGV